MRHAMKSWVGVDIKVCGWDECLSDESWGSALTVTIGSVASKLALRRSTYVRQTCSEDFIVH